MRIVCFADTHLTVPEPESDSLFPRQLATLNSKAAEELYALMRDEIQLAYSVSLEWLRKNSPWDLLVHLGDATGGWQERGCSHHSAQKVIRTLASDLVNLGCSFSIVPGDHDLGYSHGVDPSSVDFWEQTFGNLFWKQKQGDILLIGVSSSIAEYEGTERFLSVRRKRQEEFLRDALQKHNGPWILFSHKPFVLKNFGRQIEGHVGQLQRIVHGHFHDPRKEKLLRALFRIWDRDVVSDRWVLCPSTAPLWWQGYGALVLSGSEKIRAQEIALDRPAESKDLPTSSFWRCLWWMIRQQRAKSF